jgi:2-desacetyl-2-hydroxyethyl bacteriochlorophyllide A dehydrogenase
MQTLILQEPGHFRLTETEPPPQPGPGEALVRVHRVGICGTDLHAFRGRQPFFSYPRILGHELGVEVVALGPATEAALPGNLAVGDRCAVEPYLNCGRCGACRRGKTNCCERLQVLGVHVDGGMREFLVVPVHKLHKSETLPLAHLALVEMLCIGGHAVRRAQVEPGEQVLVIGAGPIGLSTIQFAQIAGAEVSVLELNPGRLAFCQEQLGVTHGLDGSEDPVDALRARLDGELPTVVFDATGNVHSMQQAFHLVANGGRLVFVGLVQADITFHDPEFHRREMTLLSSRNATGEDFQFAIRMLEEGRIDVAPWITHHTIPQELPAVFPTWLAPEAGVVKAMLDF